MRFAILSDIHGNLEALEAILADVCNESVDRIFCLGDLVGYYANPNECIALIRRAALRTVAGNHDHAALGRIDFQSSFTRYACLAMEWTQGRLNDESKSFLSGLPLILTEDPDLLLTHSTPSRPDQWEYLFEDSEDLLSNAFASFNRRICFHGHTHSPLIMTLENDRIILQREKWIRLRRDRQYLINVGSVGQPRDGDPRSGYAIYDQELDEIRLKRVGYDLETTQAKVEKAGLPAFLGMRLEKGR